MVVSGTACMVVVVGVVAVAVVVVVGDELSGLDTGDDNRVVVVFAVAVEVAMVRCKRPSTGCL